MRQSLPEGTLCAPLVEAGVRQYDDDPNLDLPDDEQVVETHSGGKKRVETPRKKQRKRCWKRLGNLGIFYHDPTVLRSLGNHCLVIRGIIPFL